MSDFIRVAKEELYGFVSSRPEYYSKADCGDLCIFAGASGMTGAAYLASYAALRSGAGLVRLATAKSNFDVIRTLIPEAICVTAEEALESLDRFDVLAFGPGTGLGTRQATLLSEILNSFKGKILIDADGITLISHSDSLKKEIGIYKNDIVITPHEGEAARLLAQSNREDLISDRKKNRPDEKKADWEVGYDRVREKRCRFISKEYDLICLLKGHRTLVSSPEGRLYTNTSGNPGMATAGSGDVLTGIITALMGQGIPAFEAAALGSLIHGYAGDIACTKLGERSLIAGDLVDCLPEAFMEITNLQAK